ncbi:MAG TPA: tail fiber domain-containing protein [Chryseolinea sp.]|nr:tail fiber domain-containing protein [Chryseolinea sp.]
MKSFKIALALCQVISLAGHAQTHYGVNAGTLGANYSYFGYYAGNAATSGSTNNSFFGSYSGRSTTSGFANTAAGYNAMYYNTQGVSNTAIGAESLFSNLAGIFNVAIGKFALYSSTTAGYNTAVGYNALYSNTTGEKNTAVGYLASMSGTYGRENVALGYGALQNGTSASNNTVTGVLASRSNVVGGLNAVYGHDAAYGVKGSYNSAFGYGSLYAGSSECSSSYNSALGASTGFGSQCINYSNATAIGYNAVVTASNQVRIGDSNVTSIGGKVSWSTLSDGRFKRDLKNDVAGLEFIKQLNPVSYVLDQDGLDKFLGLPDSARSGRAASRETTHRQVGFIAQEVESLVKKYGFVFTGIDGPKNENDAYAIRYAEFVMPLVKAVQELSASVDSRQREIGRLKEALVKYQQHQLMNRKGSTGASLSQNHPNPFSSATKVLMDVPEATKYASLIIYNLDGKQLQSIEVKERGTTSVNISANDLNSGMYLYTLVADGKVVDTKRLVLKR